MRLYICENAQNAKWRKNIADNKKLSLAFVKKCICDFIGEKEKFIEIAISKNEYGKPYVDSIYKLKNNDEKYKIDMPLFFSLSHSENMLICFIACFNIGADCQKKNIGDMKTCRKIAKRFFSEQENIYLDSVFEKNLNDLSDDEDDIVAEREYIDNFFKIWTKKESYIKYTGKGLSEGMNTFSVTGEKRHKNYCGDVYFKKISLVKSKKIKKSEANNFYIYLCYNKENRNILELKYVY